MNKYWVYSVSFILLLLLSWMAFFIELVAKHYGIAFSTKDTCDAALEFCQKKSYGTDFTLVGPLKMLPT